MKRLFATALVAAAAILVAAPTAGAQPDTGSLGFAPLQPVASLDVERYLGTWNQVAAVPQPFNLECARDTQANYQLIDANNIRVQNSCRTWDGGTSGIIGNARLNDPVTKAQLHVSFPEVPFQSSPDGPTNYIVTYIADDYSWALVGDPVRFSGFVLSRSTEVSPQQWQEIKSVVESRGYNSCFFLTSPTVGGATEIRPLCGV